MSNRGLPGERVIAYRDGLRYPEPRWAQGQRIGSHVLGWPQPARDLSI